MPSGARRRSGRWLLGLLLGVLAWMTVDVARAWTEGFAMDITFRVDASPLTVSCDGESTLFSVVSASPRPPRITGADAAFARCEAGYATFRVDRWRDTVIAGALWVVVVVAAWRGREPAGGPQPAA